MKRLMPYRDINPHDVVNMFAMNVANDSITDSGDGDAGVVVAVLSGNFGDNPVEYKTDSTLSFAGGPNMGYNGAPDVQLKVKKAASTDRAIGITLYETANKDENGEQYRRYKDKRESANVAYSGQAVPIAKRGLMTFTYKAFGTGAVKSYVPAPGSVLVQSATDGLMTGMTEAAYRTVITGSGSAFLPALGTVIATGTAYSLNGQNEYYSAGTGVYYTATCLINIA